MNKKQEQQILDYYSTADKYIRSKTHFQIPFNADEINLIYQFGEQSKAETCASLSAILPQIKDSDTKQIVSDTLKKLNALSETTCAKLTATTKRRKLTERDHSIRTRLAKAKEQAKQPTRKPRTVSTEQREWARQMMIANNKAIIRQREIKENLMDFSVCLW